MKPRILNSARLSFPLAAALAAVLAAPLAQATPYTWTNITTGAQSWTTAGNWASSAQYVDSSANELMFFSDSTTTTVLPSGTINQTFTNVPTTLAMNTLTLNGKGATSGASSTNITVGNSSTWTIGDGTTSTVNLFANAGASTAANFYYTITANLTLNQAATLFTGNGTGGVHTGANDPGFTFSGNIGQASSGYGITKSGSSRLTLSGGTLSFTGAMTVNGGSLFLTGNSNPTLASMTVNTGAILRIGNNTATQLGVGGIYSGNISTGTGGTLQLWSTSAQEFSGIISGSGGINKAYGGALTLSGPNTYTGRSSFIPQTASGFTVNVSSFNRVVGGTASSSLGAPTTVANGTIDIGSGSAQAGVTLNYTSAGETTDRVLNIVWNGNSSHTISNSVTGLLKFESAFTLTPSAGTGNLILTGSGDGEITQGLSAMQSSGLTKTGTGTWTLGGTGNFTSPTSITAGTLNLSSATALRFSPFSTASVAGGAAAGLKIATTTLSLGGLTGTNALDSRFTTALGGPSNATAKGGYAGLTALTLTNAAATTSTYSGNIVEGATGMTLTKSGAGTQFLNGTNSYTGLTTVNAGTLGSSTGFSGAVTASTGGILAPGATAGAVGTMTLSDATASALTLSGGCLLMDLTNAPSNDLVAVTGNAVLNGTNIVFPNPTTALSASSSYDILTYAAKTGSGSIVFPNGSTTLGNLTLTVGATKTTLSVGVGGLNNCVWSGATGTWDSGTNWNRNGTPSSAFVAGDFVTFDDTGTTLTVTGGTVLPASVTANNTTAKTYVILATIGGTGTPLVKMGSGTFTLGSTAALVTNTYTGGTVISGGILNLAGPTSTNLNPLLGDVNAGITLNGGQLKVTSDNLSGARQVAVLGGGGSLFVNKNNSFTTTGILTGSGTLTLLDGGGAGTPSTYNFNSTSNDFTGGMVLNNAIVNTPRFDDNTNNIVFNASLAATSGSNVNSLPGLKYTSGGSTPLTISSRSIELNGAVASGIVIQNNNTSQAITISSNLIATGAGAKILMLDAAAGPTNVFSGNITDGTGGGTIAVVKPSTTGASGTASTSVWVLSGTNSYTGTTTISTGTLAGIGANAFGNTSGISLAGAGILSLRGDSSTTFASSNVTTSATGPTINVDQATVATGAKTMTMGTLGTSSTAVAYQVNFTGANNTSLSTGAVTGPVSTAVGTVTLSNAIASTGGLTLASYTSANTTGGETLTFSGSGNTTVTGNVTPSATTLSISKTSTGNLSLNGTSNTFTGGITLSAASSGTLSYASAISTVPITFSATSQFGADVSYTGASPLTMSGLVLASALTTGGITIEANGVTSADTIIYSNASSLSTTSTNTGTRFINLAGGNTGDNTFAGAINNNTGVGGNTQLSKSGAGKWVLTGNSNFSGGFFLNQGTVSVASIPNGGTTSPLGAVTRLNLGRDNNDGTLIYTGSGDSTNRDIRLGGPSAASGTGGSTILNNGTTGALTFTATTFNVAQTGITFTRTLTLGGSNTGGVNEIQGIIQNNTASTGLVNVEKTNASTWKLSGANTYTGTTAVNGGTLTLGANNVLPDSSAISIGSATLDASTFTDTLGTLDATGAAVINLGSGGTLAFADSHLIDWTGGSLNITVSGSLGATAIRFGTTSAGLTSGQLATITVNGSGAGTYSLDSNGYLVSSGPGPVDHFVISAISSPQTVGTAITGITLTAQDASNVTATGFTGTVTFSGTGGFTGSSGSFTAGVLSGVSVTPSLSGTSRTLVVTDGVSGKTGTATFDVQSLYDAWAAGPFANAFTDKDPASNPDGDTLTNLQEFAFGTDPTVSSTGPITWTAGSPVGTVNTHGTPVAYEENGHFYAVYGRRVDYSSAGLTYTPRFSVDLISPWASIPIGSTPEVIATDSIIEAVRIEFGLIDVGSGPQKARFFDLGVSQ